MHMGGQVLGGGVIVLVAVLLWLVYLLPSWHSRRQFDAAERNAVRLNQALRVLAETSEMPQEVHLELNARTAMAQQRLARQALAQRESAGAQKLGRGLVHAMPRLMTVISVVGTAAMLWVGGHILLNGVDDLGWHALYDLVHHAEEAVHDAVEGIGAALAWLVNTAASALIGLVVGAVAVAVMHVLPFGKKKH